MASAAAVATRDSFSPTPITPAAEDVDETPAMEVRAAARAAVWAVEGTEAWAEGTSEEEEEAAARRRAALTAFFLRHSASTSLRMLADASPLSLSSAASARRLAALRSAASQFERRMSICLG
jgi:hypothetical protein